MTNRPYTDEDVRHFATFITGHPDADVSGPPLAASRAILSALAEDGRLRPVLSPAVLGKCGDPHDCHCPRGCDIP